ncbi:MAG: EAL domain-containing protein [Halomonadaceae bacterium]|nr:MAG: EAL domain-containing protein [Halomonadaceae bacterium]
MNDPATSKQLSRDDYRLLVVDDDLRLLESLSELLAAHDYVIDTASGGESACRMLESSRYDLVLLDLHMPEVDGYDVMAFMARKNIAAAVVVVSGEASFSAASRALRRGAYDYIRKPYDGDELIAIIDSALEARHLVLSHRAIQKRLKQSEELHRYIVNSSPDIVFILDKDGTFCFLNSQIEALLGYGPGELVGSHYHELIDETEVPRADWAFNDPAIAADSPRTLELRLKTRGASRGNRHFEITAFPLDAGPMGLAMEDSDHRTQIYGTARDITERKEAEAFINYQAYHDLLTRLPNRALFKDRLSLAIAHAQRDNQSLAVMFLDLDRFKVINDTLGHAMGDRLLQAVTRRLEGCLRQGDTLSRFGGDEFTLLLPAIGTPEDARTIALKLIAALKPPFQLGEHEAFVGVSIGISMYPEAGLQMEQLIQRADIAMYHVKGRGKDGYQFYSDSMNVDTTQRLSLERDLRRALSNDELRVHYQPQICTLSGRLKGVEALVRWQHPSRGLLQPADFLPLAEETRLIGDLSEWVLHRACCDIRPWLNLPSGPLRLSVNFSPMQVEHPKFVERLMGILKRCDFPPERLEIELIENILISDLEQISRKLDQLASQGVRVAIDDFGTGYSSLSYLQRLPIHTLKVDQSFVQAIRHRDQGACIVNAIIAMAQGLQLDIVAEGVETRAQLDYLRDLGCDQVQGFFYGPAQPISDVMASHQVWFKQQAVV